MSNDKDMLAVYISSNDNLSDGQKVLLYDELNKTKRIYNLFGVDYNFDYVADKLKTLRLKEAGQNDIISYDSNDNVLIIGSSPINQTFNTYVSLLELTSNNGLKVQINNEQYGSEINKKIINKMIVYSKVCDYEEEEETLSEINLNDSMLYDLCEVVGKNNLVNLFAFGRGQELYNLISQRLGSNTVNFYRSIDEYKNNKLNQLVYDVCIKVLKDKKDNNLDITPKM